MSNDDDEDKVIRLADLKPIFDEKYQRPEARPDIKSTADVVSWLNITHFKTYLGGNLE